MYKRFNYNRSKHYSFTIKIKMNHLKPFQKLETNSGQEKCIQKCCNNKKFGQYDNK